MKKILYGPIAVKRALATYVPSNKRKYRLNRVLPENPGALQRLSMVKGIGWFVPEKHWGEKPPPHPLLTPDFIEGVVDAYIPSSEHFKMMNWFPDGTKVPVGPPIKWDPLPWWKQLWGTITYCYEELRAEAWEDDEECDEECDETCTVCYGENHGEV